MAETATRTLAPCGTAGAHSRHRRRGEPIDEVCRAARRAADSERKARLRATKRAAWEAREAAVMAAAARLVQRREIRVVRLPGADMPLGALACSDRRHPFMPDAGTGSQCLGCFGWYNDARHTGILAVAR